MCTVLGGITAGWEILNWWPERAPAAGFSPAPRTGEDSTNEGPAEIQPEVLNEPVPEVPRSRPTDPAGKPPGAVPDPLEELVNRRLVPSTNAVTMAIVLDGDPGDVEMLEAKFVDSLSTPRLQLIPGYFKPAFKRRGFFRAAYDGDTDILARSGALAAVDRVLLGRVERSCGKNSDLDADLVSCALRLNYKTIGRSGAIVSSGSVSVIGAGFSDEAARDRALEMLVEQHGERLISFE